MLQRPVLTHLSIVSISLMVTSAYAAPQLPPSSPLSSQAPTAQQTAATPSAGPQEEKIVLPKGTHLPLALQNGINTRTAKAGDSVYFQTLYPIAQDNRMVIPMGTFVRGQILEAKRPGFIKGRGEFRMVLDQLTFPNGYTIALTATPNSADTGGRAGVDTEARIRGPANTKSDVGTILATTAGSAYIGTLAGAIYSGAPGKGAAIGGGAGLLAGLAVVLLTRGPEAELPRGTTLDVVFDRPLVLDAALLPSGDKGEYSHPLIPAAPEMDHRGSRKAHHPPLLPPFIPFLNF